MADVENTRVYYRKGPRLTPEDIKAIYRRAGVDGVRVIDPDRTIWPHAHQCSDPNCYYEWYCEKRHKMDPYIPAVSGPTDPNHNCNDHREEPIEIASS